MLLLSFISHKPLLVTLTKKTVLINPIQNACSFERSRSVVIFFTIKTITEAGMTYPQSQDTEHSSSPLVFTRTIDHEVLATQSPLLYNTGVYGLQKFYPEVNVKRQFLNNSIHDKALNKHSYLSNRKSYGSAANAIL